MDDVYFTGAYGQAHAVLEGGQCSVFVHESCHGSVRNMFIRREVASLASGKQYYDILTPYGYGGPVLQLSPGGNAEALLQSYAQAFSAYCQENNIVCEFIRFHPIAGNAAAFHSLYHIQHRRYTVATLATASIEETLNAEFSPSSRRNIQKAERLGLTYDFIPQPDDLSTFRQLYMQTMMRNRASAYHCFGEGYFGGLVKALQPQLLLIHVRLGTRIIAAALCFDTEDILHVHLSGIATPYMHHSPAYLLKKAEAVWACTHGRRLVHYGGGRTDASEDSLYQFKRQFTRNTVFPFHTASHVWLPEIYTALCTAVQINPDTSGYFPPYRLAAQVLCDA